MPDQDAIPFPFEPYPQQRDLMRSIYDCIEKSSVGCFESPTGTGKSLSVICAAMSWQFKEEDRLLAKQSSVSLKSKSSKEDDWLVAFQSSFENDSAECKRNQRAYDLHLAMKERVRRASLSNPQQRNHGNQYRKMSKSNDTSRDMGSDVNHSESKSEVEDEFSLKHYDSSDECSQTSKRNSSQTSASRTDCSDSEDDDDDDENALGLPKIYYCSRTHSQISQFVTEIKRTAFANARCITLGSRRNMCINSEVTKLGSDSKISEMCLDMQKSKSKIVKATDENGYQSRKQKTKTPSLKPCQYHNKEKEKDFADYANGKIHDIESLITLGDQLAACPYYATRRAVHDAQIVCLPYNMLLHDDLRASMGIHLANSVVIFDEAHNVIDAVNQIYSADVSYDQLVLAGQCVEEYSKRFQSVLTGKNYYYVNILISVINGLKRSLKVDKKKVASVHSSLNDITNSDKKNPLSTAQTAVRQTTASQAGPGPQTEIPEILGANDFLFRCGLDNVNLFKVRRHIVETNLDSKIGGYCDHLAKKRAEAELEQQTHTVNIHSKNQKAKQVYSTGNKATDTCSTSLSGCCSNEKSSVIDIEESIKNTTGGYKQALRSILTLITCLTNADIDGRIAITKNHPDSTVEKSSTSTSSTTSTSTSSSSSGSIKFVLLNPSLHFQKVVDQARSVLLLGGTLQPFAYLKSFLFPKVSSEKLKLFACGHVVPSSSVLALASGCGPQGGKFEFTHDTRMQCTTLNELHNSLKLISGNVPHGMVVFFSSYQYMGAVLSIWRSTNILNDLEVNKSLFIEPRLAVDAERVWISYSEKAIANHGKGAMLFCVMGGKLSEGINFSDKLARCVVVIGMPYPDGRDPVLQEKLKFATVVEGDDNAGKRLYESMCMRTVNQCIGRSIRHINDYAAVVLLDCRYSHPRVTTQLPMWLSGEVQSCTTFKEVVSKLKEFFLTRTSTEQIVD